MSTTKSCPKCEQPMLVDNVICPACWEGMRLTDPAGEAVTFTPQPQSITFHIPGGEWAIRITKAGVESNPNVKVDDGAKAMFAALEPHLRSLSN